VVDGRQLQLQRQKQTPFGNDRQKNKSKNKNKNKSNNSNSKSKDKMQVLRLRSCKVRNCFAQDDKFVGGWEKNNGKCNSNSNSRFPSGMTDRKARARAIRFVARKVRAVVGTF